MKKDLLKRLKEKISTKPLADIARCSECGWEGNVSECIKGEEGDWESGYYEIDECPKCEDGGCIDDYDYSEDRYKELEEWEKKNEL